jgi:hypothetical protein
MSRDGRDVSAAAGPSSQGNGAGRPKWRHALAPPIAVFFAAFGLVTSVIFFLRREPVQASYQLFVAIVAAASLGRMYWLWRAGRW